MKLPGPGADDDAGRAPSGPRRLAQQLVGVREHADSPGGALAQHLPVADERAVATLVAVSNASVSTSGKPVEQ